MRISLKESFSNDLWIMDKENTKQRILAEALNLFSKNGYQAVSVEQIAKVVGIKAPSLYKHYNSKQDIFDAIFAEMQKCYDAQYVTRMLEYHEVLFHRLINDGTLM